jgi:proline iminopeptidase
LPAYAPDFGAVKVPTLILAGAHDHIIGPEHGSARLHREIRGSQLHTFEASGHFPFIEEPDAFVAVVSTWLASLEE